MCLVEWILRGEKRRENEERKLFGGCLVGVGMAMGLG